MPSSNDILFAAGFYEGEGYCRRRQYKGGYLVVQITQKDPEILHRLQGQFGGTIQFLPHSGKKGVYVLVIRRQQAEEFLQVIYPHLSKRRRIQIRELDICAGGII